jgi:hypothetical protein
MGVLAEFYVRHVDAAIEMAEADAPREVAEILGTLPGMSSRKGRLFLNFLLKTFGIANYLEIGSWMGSTFCSALYGNPGINGFAIDNFSQFVQSEHQPFPVRETLMKNIETYAPHGKFFDCDCWDIDKSQFPKIDVYFFDGLHDEESQYKAFVEYDQVLADTFIAIVDDWEFEPHYYDVQLGTMRAFKDLGYRVVRQWILPRAEYYHEGMFVAVVEKTR